MKRTRSGRSVDHNDKSQKSRENELPSSTRRRSGDGDAVPSLSTPRTRRSASKDNSQKLAATPTRVTRKSLGDSKGVKNSKPEDKSSPNKKAKLSPKKDQTTKASPTKQTEIQTHQGDGDANTKTPPRRSGRNEGQSPGSLQCLKNPKLLTDKEKSAWSNYKGQFKSLCNALNVEDSSASASDNVEDTDSTRETRGSRTRSTGRQETQKSAVENKTSPASAVKRGRGRPKTKDADEGDDGDVGVKRKDKDAEKSESEQVSKRGRPRKSDKSDSDSTNDSSDKKETRKRKAVADEGTEKSTKTSAKPSSLVDNTEDAQSEEEEVDCQKVKKSKESLKKKDDDADADVRVMTDVRASDHSYPVKEEVLDTNEEESSQPSPDHSYTNTRLSREGRRKYKFSCEYCSQGFMLNYLLDLHYKSCKEGKKKKHTESGMSDEEVDDGTKSVFKKSVKKRKKVEKKLKFGQESKGLQQSKEITQTAETSKEKAKEINGVVEETMIVEKSPDKSKAMEVSEGTEKPALVERNGQVVLPSEVSKMTEKDAVVEKSADKAITLESSEKGSDAEKIVEVTNNQSETMLVTEALLQMQTGGNEISTDDSEREVIIIVKEPSTEGEEVTIEQIVISEKQHSEKQHDERGTEQITKSDSQQKVDAETSTQTEEPSTKWSEQQSSHPKRSHKKRILEDFYDGELSQEVLDSLQCPACEKKFKAVEYLRRHMIVHTPDTKQLKCQVCSKCFTRKYDLHIHLIRLHNWVRTGRGVVISHQDLEEEGEIKRSEKEDGEIKKQQNEDDNVSGQERSDCTEVQQKMEDGKTESGENQEEVVEEKDNDTKVLEKQTEAGDKGQEEASKDKIVEESENDDKDEAKTDETEDENLSKTCQTSDESCMCAHCGKEFISQKYLDKHTARYHDPEGSDKDAYECHQCDVKLNSIREFHSHLKSHGSEKVFKCDKCPKSFYRQPHLIRHSYTHLTDRNFKCEECNKCYKDPDALKKHMKSFHQSADGPTEVPQTYACKKCNKVFNSPHYLKRHEFRHTGARPFKCNVCNKYFAEKNSLQSHARIHTGERPYKCGDCGRAFVQASHLNRHRFLHTQIRNVECEKCGKKFFEKSDLSKHLKQHDEIKPYKCDICEMAFSQKSTLVCHRRRHTGEKPYQCDICHRCFTQLSSLQTHHRLHTGERPYKCPHCDMGFVSKERMKVHQFVHTGILPHVCNLCGKGFRLKFKLQNHIDSHHGVFRHKCQFCDKGFNEKGRLNRHVKMVHEGNLVPIEGSTRVQYTHHGVPQEIIVQNIPQAEVQGASQEIVEYVTIPSTSAEESSIETNHAVSHITLEEGSELSALLESMPQDSVIYEGEDEGGKVVYVVIPEENETVILS